MDKRGQAIIITSVIIILIVLAAIVIVWNVVNSTVTEKSNEIRSKITAISDINLRINKVFFYSTRMYISVQNSGQQDISSFIVKITSANNETYLNNSIYLKNKEKLGPLNTKSIIVIPAPFGNISSNYSLIEVYPKFEFNGEEEIAETGKDEFKVTSGGGSDTISSGNIQTITQDPDTGGGIIEETRKVKVAMESGLWRYWAVKDKWDCLGLKGCNVDGNYTAYLESENEEFVKLGIKYKIIGVASRSTLEQEVREAEEYGLKLIVASTEMTYNSSSYNNYPTELSDKLKKIEDFGEYLKTCPEVIEAFWVNDDSNSDKPNHAIIRAKIKEYFPNIPLVVSPTEGANYNNFYAPYPEIVLGQNYGPWWSKIQSSCTEKTWSEKQQEISSFANKLKQMQDTKNISAGIFAMGFGYYGGPLIERTLLWTDCRCNCNFHGMPASGELYWQLKNAYDTNLTGYLAIYTSLWDSPVENDIWAGVWDYETLIIQKTKNWTLSRTRLWDDIKQFTTDYGV